MARRLAISFVVCFFAFIVSRSLFAAPVPVTVTEQQVIIPTYLMGDPDPNPQFYNGGNSQGAEHRIYPYPMYDNLTTEKVNKSYKMVYLENEYVKIGILPEIGGKIFEAVDKTNGYDFFYHQHVIKPALISLLGAWISGGVEWDIPHHHRATSFLPIQYHIDSNPDGSKTVWVGELELRDRMEWTVGVTLHPGKSYIEASFRIANRTPVPTSMLCFSNVAVSTNDTYQVIFPPSTRHVTYHGKRDFTTWPIATTRFNGADFTAGVDVSWIKNHYNSMSMFAWNYQDDFVAGYDHGKNAGTMAIADHNVVPGKKFFTWGNGPGAQSEYRQLTDNDGPYAELMVGAYSDNQPDYTWLAPYETRQWTQYWYPFRDIDGAKNANTDAAVNLDAAAGKIHLGFYATSDRPSATASLKWKARILLNDQISINPGKPYVKDIDMPAGADVHDLDAALLVDGRELVAYSPVKLEPEPMPAVVTPFPPPAEIKTNEELLLAGTRIEQFHAPGASPDPYWQEALKRDPGDVRVNTAMAIDAIKGGRFAEAEQYLRTALVRATDRYTTPKDGEPFYYLGLALKAQGKSDEAFEKFSKSTWSAQWRSPGYFEMAQIASGRGNVDQSLTYLDDSLDANAKNIRALGLKAAMLRTAGRTDEALLAVAAIRKIDPLDVRAMAEEWLIDKSSDSLATLTSTVNQFPTTGLELGAEYLDAGLWTDGSTVLSQLVAATADQTKVSPMFYDYLAHFALQMNFPDKAAACFASAQKMPTDFVFPFQMEMIPVFEEAMKANPADARSPYYLGNLLYDWQPDRAAALWEKSASLHADFPVVYRNLAMVAAKQTQRDKELADLESAAQVGGNGMVFNDLDALYEENGISPQKRLSVMESHAAVINRDSVISREIDLDVFAGKYDDAIKLIDARFFRTWEGGGGGRSSLGDSWVDAHVLKGEERLAAKDFKAALDDFQAAQTLPESAIEAGAAVAGRHSEISYWIGVTYDAQGDQAKAKQAWTDASAAPADGAPGTGGRGAARGGGRAGGRGGRGGSNVAAGVHIPDAQTYYQALAFARLGKLDRAKALYQQLADTGARNETGLPDVATFVSATVPADQRMRAADAHFIAGLGQLGLGNVDKAKAEFTQALEASPDHLAAKVALVGADGPLASQ